MGFFFSLQNLVDIQFNSLKLLTVKTVIGGNDSNQNQCSDALLVSVLTQFFNTYFPVSVSRSRLCFSGHRDCL